MKARHILFIAIILIIVGNGEALSAANFNLDFTRADGMKARYTEVSPEASTGLEKIYIIDNASGVKASVNGQNAATAEWFVFGNLGAAYAERVESQVDGNVSSCTLGSDDHGIVIENDGRRYCYWIINAANHPCTLSSISLLPEASDCSTACLSVEGECGRIVYYTINGVPKEYNRNISVEYTTLEFDEESGFFKQTQKTVNFPYVSSEIRIPQPLCSTRFTLSTNGFEKNFGTAVTLESDYCHPTAVEAHTTAVQTGREVDNEIRVDAESLGGSAPIEITFSALVTDAVVFTEWQFSRDPEFNSIDLRYSETDVTYVFEDYGTTYVRFQAANSAGDCEWFSEVYTVSVSESKLVCPNAFSPNDDGVNDLWKVSYKSIVSFECTIFNRWGVKIAELNDPSEGWDGKYNGKTVPSGVYYYVIKARGSDGIKYDLAGDINIIGVRKGYGSSSGDSGSELTE